MLHAILINVALGLAFTFVMLAFGRRIYRALGAAGGELEAALAYSNVVFAGNVLLWLLNGLASVIRGTGNMLVPALVICVGVVMLVPLSPLLIFGVGPFPALTTTVPAVLRLYPRESTTGRKPSSLRRSASRITSGVLPVPPTVRLPTLITGYDSL